MKIHCGSSYYTGLLGTSHRNWDVLPCFNSEGSKWYVNATPLPDFCKPQQLSTDSWIYPRKRLLESRSALWSHLEAAVQAGEGGWGQWSLEAGSVEHHPATMNIYLGVHGKKRPGWWRKWNIEEKEKADSAK